MENKSEIAKLRRIVKAIDTSLALCDSDEALGPHEYQETQALIDALLRARMCVSNMLLRYGDESGYVKQPPVLVMLVRK